MTQNQKYSYIDSLRGYAVLMVLGTHIYSHACHIDKTIVLGSFWVQCRMGIMLFFMISALTLFLSFEKKSGNENNPVRNFFLRRLFRIAPLFYIVCIYYLIINNYHPFTIISSLLFVNDLFPKNTYGLFGVSWTISVEMLFYLLIPLLFKYIRTLPQATIFFLATLVLSIISKILVFKFLSTYYEQMTLMGFVYYWLPAQLPVFSLGIILYFLIFKANIDWSGVSVFRSYLGYILIFAGLYFFLTMSYSTKLFITENIAFSFALLLFIVGNFLNDTSVFNNIVMQFIGKISYSFYFIHAILIELLIKLQHQNILYYKGNISFVIYFFGILFLTSVLAYLTYRLIELPFQKLGSKLIAKMEHKRAVGKDDILIL